MVNNASLEVMASSSSARQRVTTRESTSTRLLILEDGAPEPDLEHVLSAGGQGGRETESSLANSTII